jgi:hypothetical protein
MNILTVINSRTPLKTTAVPALCFVQPQLLWKGAA